MKKVNKNASCILPKKTPKMRKIAINPSYGGFGLNQEVLKLLFDRGSKHVVHALYRTSDFDTKDLPRDDKLLIEVLEEYGPEKTGVKIVEIPANVKWQIDEYDGLEWVAEVHRRWS
jgi:hypothetical protein